MKYTITTVLFVALLSALQAQIGIELNPELGDCFCEGTPQQPFSVTAEGSAGPFTYEWSSPNGYSSTAKEPDDIVLAGEYTLEVYNAYACSFTYSVVLEACTGPTFQFNTTPASPTCPGQITAQVEAPPGSPDTYISYEWYNEAGDLLSDEGLTLEDAAAGSYYMVAISEAGCRFSSPMVEVEGLQDLQAIITSQTAACNGQATGGIAISVSGGQPPYAYQLGTQPVGQGPGQFALNNIAPGFYELFITDAGECELNFSFDIENDPPPQITATLSPPSCPASSNGQIELEITQLLPPQVNYTVSWSNGSTGNPLQGAAAGTYTATVISDNGCEYPAGPFQLQAEEFGLEFNVLSTDASCPEAANGSAIIHPSVFPNPFSQQLTIKLTASYAGNAQVNLVNLLGQVVHTERHEFIRGYTPIQVSTSALGLTPGLYQVVVTDELGNYYTEKIMYQP
jgi:hypothetical protein